MSDITHVYWKLKEGKSSEYISGYCPPENLPSYGEIGHAPLPTEIEVSVDDDGVLTATSPLVFGARRVYRYHLRITPQCREEIPTMTQYRVENLLSPMEVQAPHAGVDRENWWWYAKDDFRHLGYGVKTPTSLLRKWKGPMLEILLENHPQKDEWLSEWQSRVKNHRQRNSKRSTSSASRKKRHGELVVLPQRNHFNNSGPKQVFRYHIAQPDFAGRAKHTLRIHGTAYKTPHGQAMSFADGEVSSSEVSIPMKAVLPVLAWAESPLKSAHDIIAADARFCEMAAARITELMEWIKDTVESEQHPVAIYCHKYDLQAANAALLDFCPKSPHQNAGALEQEARTKIRGIASTLGQVLQKAICGMEETVGET